MPAPAVADAESTTSKIEKEEWCDFYDEYAENVVLPLAGPFMVWKYTIQTNDSSSKNYLIVSFVVWLVLSVIGIIDTKVNEGDNEDDDVKQYIRQPFLLTADYVGIVYPIFCIMMQNNYPGNVNEGVNVTTVLFLIESLNNLISGSLIILNNDKDYRDYWDFARIVSANIVKIVLAIVLLAR